MALCSVSGSGGQLVVAKDFVDLRRLELDALIGQNLLLGLAFAHQLQNKVNLLLGGRSLPEPFYVFLHESNGTTLYAMVFGIYDDCIDVLMILRKYPVWGIQFLRNASTILLCPPIRANRTLMDTNTNTTDTARPGHVITDQHYADGGFTSYADFYDYHYAEGRHKDDLVPVEVTVAELLEMEGVR